jgi:hypothetical protein
VSRVSKTLHFLGPVICVTALACAAREPVYIDPDLSHRTIETIALAPIVDLRSNPFEDVQVGSYVRHGVENALVRKHYHVVSTRQAPSESGARTAADLAPSSDEELARLAPDGVSYVLVVSVDTLRKSSQDLGDTTHVTVSGRLLEAPSGRVLWRDMAEGGPVLTGLLSIFRGASTSLEGAYDASHLLVSTLPDQTRATEGAVSTEVPVSETPGGLRPGQTR